MEGHDRQRYKAWHRMMMMIIIIIKTDPRLKKKDGVRL